jgi:hypothetical protein
MWKITSTEKKVNTYKAALFVEFEDVQNLDIYFIAGFVRDTAETIHQGIKKRDKIELVLYN